MKLIKSDNQQCVLASFAMVLGRAMEELEQFVGHNGLEVILPEQQEPYCFRSFHPQEFVDVCQGEGYALTMFELHPHMKHGTEVVDHSHFIGHNRFFKALIYGSGVIFGVLSKDGDEPKGHAVAWNCEDQQIYDPRGYKYPWTEGQDFYPKQFFLLQKVEEPCTMKYTEQNTAS